MVDKDARVVTEINTESDFAPQNPGKTRVFLTIVGINVLLNYDTGVVPASLSHLEEGLNLSFQQQALVGSLVYIGLCAASLIVSLFFQKYSARKVLILMLVLNCFFCFVFSLCRSHQPMYVARFGMGFTQAFCVIYAPVWTNEFAPHKKCTSWMGILQCAVPLGVVFGYSVASLFNLVDNDYINWRFAIQIQAILEIPFIISLYLSEPEDIDIINPDKIVASGECSNKAEEEIRIDSISLSNLPGFCAQLKMLFENLVFVFLTLALCCLFFVVSGIQYWVSLYMINVLEASKITVLIAFVLISTTAPISGVLVGGYISDYYGGYKGKNILTAMKICLFFGTFAFSSAIPAGYVQSPLIGTLLIWLLLFFGACIVPPATGIIVNTMPKETQSSSSALSQLIYNLGGFFLAPISSSFIMDTIQNKKQALIIGFRFCLDVSLISFLFALVAFVLILKQEKFNSNADQDLEYEDLPEEFNQEVARRVKPLSIS